MKYCSKCGTACEDDAKFCSVCGAPLFSTVNPENNPAVSVAAETASENNPAAVQAETMYSTPAQKKRNNSVGKIILTILLILVISVGGLLGLSYLFRESWGPSLGKYFPIDLFMDYKLDIPWLHTETQGNSDVSAAVSAEPSATAIPTLAPSKTPVPSQTAASVSYIKGASSAFYHAYISYLTAINMQDPSQLSGIGDAQRNIWEERITGVNADYTYVNNHIRLDMNSFTTEYDNNILTAKFNVAIDNTGKKRSDATTFSNILAEKVTAQYDDANEKWIISEVTPIDMKDLGTSLQEIQ